VAAEKYDFIFRPITPRLSSQFCKVDIHPMIDKNFLFGFLSFNAGALHPCLNEFKNVLKCDVDFQVECIFKSNAFPNERQVFKLTSNNQEFALKIDTQSEKTGRLKAEFDTLKRLHSYFQAFPKFDVVRPIYLANNGSFFVTEYINAPSAIATVSSSNDQKKIAQVFRRSGIWLNHLHQIETHEDTKFWPGWMLKEIDNPVYHQLTKASQSVYEPAIMSLKNSAHILRGKSARKVFSHGDLHGNNILIGKGTTCGLDCTESKPKLAVYDIVDIITMDVLINADPSDIGRMGIVEQNYTKFFRGYNLPINHEILNFCIRARLLISWLKISKDRYEKSKFQRNKFHEHEKRIHAAFN
jgi:thiamine kinase-like enzyme